MLITKAPLVALTVALAISIFATAAIGADAGNNKKPAQPKHSAQTSGQKISEAKKAMAKVTGIGGVFFKSKDNKALAEWYQKNLGMSLEPWGGAILRWKDDKAEDGGGTAWHVMEQGTDHFAPSQGSFMINYRIDDMAKMIEQLKSNGVPILKGPESHENGKFLWVVDPDGNKVELWEPKIWDDKNKNL